MNTVKLITTALALAMAVSTAATAGPTPKWDGFDSARG